jgi:Cdc6-like AAA superfamily ATPase
MEGMPTIPGKDPEIMNSGEIAIAKRREKLNELLQHGDPFTDRFICTLGQIACIAKEIVETESIPRYALKKGINGSNIFAYGPCEFGKDFTVIKPVMEKLKESVEKFRIGFGLWENTYSFKDYDELIQTIIQCLLDKTKELKQCQK